MSYYKYVTFVIEGSLLPFTTVQTEAGKPYLRYDVGKNLDRGNYVADWIRCPLKPFLNLKFSASIFISYQFHFPSWDLPLKE